LEGNCAGGWQNSTVLPAVPAKRTPAMTHKGRILADRIVAVPLALLFNGIARLLGWLLRRDHSITPENVSTIVVAKLIGMGSILQATPLLKAMKQRYPQAKVIFVTLRSNRELLSRISYVDEALTVDDRSLPAMAYTTLKTMAILIARHADLYMDLEVYSAFASLLALGAMTRNRIGFYRYSTAFKKGIYTHLVYFNTRMPIRHLYLQLGRVFGVPAGQSELTGPIRIEDPDRARLPSILSQAPGWQTGKPYIVVNPNASDLLLERRWPVEHAMAALSSLVSSGHQVALIGAPNERAFVQSLHERLPVDVQARVANTAGSLSLGELCALLDEAACVLTNDTGPMHMAIALRRPTVCLFGPANPEHYGQELPYVEIFYAPVFCSPCLYEADEPPCNGNNICMQRLNPQSVVQSVRRFVECGSLQVRSGPTNESSLLPIIADAPEGTPLGVVVRASVR
jgi:heptosyltransferase-2